METIQLIIRQIIEIIEHVIIWVRNRCGIAHAC
jgi:hypothetical protein